MKTMMVTALVMLLCGCSATVVSVKGDGKNSSCPPLVSVQSFGNNVTISDSSECRVTTK